MKKQPTQLVCSRLTDMTIVHPRQIERSCTNCKQIVGIYPSGQDMLKRFPKIEIWCVHCAIDEFHPDDEHRFAGTLKQVLQEERESVPKVIQ
jgi:hypothetical protein